MPKDKLWRIINSSKGDGKSLFKSKKSINQIKSTRNSFFKLKRGKIKKSLNKPAKNNFFKSKIKETKEIFYDPLE